MALSILDIQLMIKDGRLLPLLDPQCAPLHLSTASEPAAAVNRNSSIAACVPVSMLGAVLVGWRAKAAQKADSGTPNVLVFFSEVSRAQFCEISMMRTPVTLFHAPPFSFPTQTRFLRRRSPYFSSSHWGWLHQSVCKTRGFILLCSSTLGSLQFKGVLCHLQIPRGVFVPRGGHMHAQL